MRFSAPRSTSPSPERPGQLSPSSPRKFLVTGQPQRRRSCSYGLRDDSESEEDDEDEEESDDSQEESVTSDDDSDDDLAESLQYVSLSPPRNPLRPRLHPLEAKYIEDTVAAIRIHTRHFDPYEEWEKQTRRDAFRTARQNQSTTLHELHTSQINKRAAKLSVASTTHAVQLTQVAHDMATRRELRQHQEAKMRRSWAEREKEMWIRVEEGIKLDEEKVRVALEEERRRKEEEERKKREEETRRRLEEERIKAAEDKERREEEERLEQERLQQEERRRQEEAAAARRERKKVEEEAMKALGMTTAEEDWRGARFTLKRLKGPGGPMKTVKANKDLKSAWSTIRRQITPKIGQLTNDPQSIIRVSQQVHAMLRSCESQSQTVYVALLSSLSKAILLQAETEVTASKAAAGPLAQVAVNLLGEHHFLSNILYAKLVQRVGGWAVPANIPSVDLDVEYETKATTWVEFTPATREKAMGYRLVDGGVRETQSEYIARVAGIMRVYFHILIRATALQPLDRMWQTPRYWAYFARMIGGAVDEVGNAVVPEVLYVALDVGGGVAAQIWGHQWNKMLGLLYEGVSTGRIGGTTPEGKAARVRVQLEIERIMSGTKS